MSDLHAELRDYLSRTFLIDFRGPVEESSNLFDLGYLDSYGYIELIKHLETTYGLSISEEEMLSDALNSLHNIVVLVSSKRSTER
ncbi:MAG: hypothetical protein A2284_15860 [Deltaproteobacteria bacterium RIFOXYA12_FULL_61_11]|nr:MAG: hypothetical protein A2284_15860 [Deltaproteobacteria bacterium RIFOXYA12_FULL_61_11]